MDSGREREEKRREEKRRTSFRRRREYYEEVGVGVGRGGRYQQLHRAKGGRE